MSAVPYTFANASGQVPASELDVNFANVKAAVDTAGIVTTNAQPNITSVGTLTALSVTGNVTTGNVTSGNVLTGGRISATGNITGNYFIGNGSQLTGIVAVSTYGNSNVTTLLADFGSNTLSTTGNITSGNVLTDGLISSTGNVRGGNINTAGLVTANTLAVNQTANAWVISGNTISAPSGARWNSNPATLDEYVTSAANGYINLTSLYANSSTASQVHLEHGLAQIVVNNGSEYIWAFDDSGDLSAPGNVSAAGNIITAGYFVGNFAGNITGNLVVPGSNTQVLFNNQGNAGATAGLTFDTAGPNLLTINGNVQAGNLLTAGLISATANITAGNLSGTNIVGTLTTASQTNITSVGTLGSLSVTGNINAGNVIATNLSGPVFLANVLTGQGVPTSPSGISQLPLMYDNISANIGGGYAVGNSVIGSTFTAPVSGFYQVSAAIGVTPSNWANVTSYSSIGAIGVYKNNNPVAAGPSIDFIGLTIGNVVLQITTSSSISTLVDLDAGDTIDCKLAYITTAPTNFWNTSTNAIQGYFQACWVRGA